LSGGVDEGAKKRAPQLLLDCAAAGSQDTALRLAIFDIDV